MIKLLDILKEISFTPNKHMASEANELIDYLNSNQDLQKLKAKVGLHGSLKHKPESLNDIDLGLKSEFDVSTINGYYDFLNILPTLNSDRAKKAFDPALEIVTEELEKLGFKIIKTINFPQEDDIIIYRFQNKQGNTIELWT